MPENPVEVMQTPHRVPTNGGFKARRQLHHRAAIVKESEDAKAAATVTEMMLFSTSYSTHSTVIAYSQD